MANEYDRNQSLKRTVQEFPDVAGGPSLPSIILQAAVAADEAPAWWSHRRDVYLSKFWPTEPFLAGAIYAVSTRNASFRYELHGPEKDIWRSQDMLNQANFGEGWQPFIMKLTNDILCSDNAGFIEVIRPAKARTSKCTYDAIKSIDPDTGKMSWFPYDRHSGKIKYSLDFKMSDSPLDLPVGIAHLDSHKCTRTGDPDYPVLYTDLKGNIHKLAYYQVITIEDMPSPRQEMHNVGYSSITRCLRLAQILRDMNIYKHEKVSGRFARAVHITNADALQLQDAINKSNAAADSAGLTRYSQPIILNTVNPTTKPEVATLALASLPDSFSEEETMRWYIAGVANALGVDYGFLAPLPGNKLGTSDQAETQAQQARGKSSRLFMETLQNKFNYAGLFPRTVSFRFADADPWEESERDRALALRARSLSILVKAGIIPEAIARQMSADWGDLDPKYLEMLGEADLTPMQTIGNSDVKIPVQFTPKVDLAQFQSFKPAPSANSLNEGNGLGSNPGKTAKRTEPGDNYGD